MRRVLFLSASNSCRSQMAEALVNNIYRGRIDARSAGVNPVPVNENTRLVLSEIGINIDNQTTNTPEDFKDEAFDYIITMCQRTKDDCPIYWTKGEAIYSHMEVVAPDPLGKSPERYMQAFRDVRDEIENQVTTFFDREIRNNPEVFREEKFPPREEKYQQNLIY